MRDAAVGHHCAECAGAGVRTVRPVSRRSPGPWGSTTPMVTYVLIAINVLAFIAQKASSHVAIDFVMWSPAVADG
jgi:hypothetical protein